jgi:hypothetical protein
VIAAHAPGAEAFKAIDFLLTSRRPEMGLESLDVPCENGCAVRAEMHWFDHPLCFECWAKMATNVATQHQYWCSSDDATYLAGVDPETIYARAQDRVAQLIRQRQEAWFASEDGQQYARDTRRIVHGIKEKLALGPDSV